MNCAATFVDSIMLSHNRRFLRRGKRVDDCLKISAQLRPVGLLASPVSEQFPPASVCPIRTPTLLSLRSSASRGESEFARFLKIEKEGETYSFQDGSLVPGRLTRKPLSRYRLEPHRSDRFRMARYRSVNIPSGKQHRERNAKRLTRPGARGSLPISLVPRSPEDTPHPPL